MVTSTRTSRASIAHPSSTTSISDTPIAAELRHADHIIKVMLSTMTARQKIKVGALLEADGVAGDGITRHHERAAAIAAFAATPTTPSLTADEERALSLYRRMNNTDRDMTVTMMAEWARKWPRHPAPRLQLVKGGAL